MVNRMRYKAYKDNFVIRGVEMKRYYSICNKQVNEIRLNWSDWEDKEQLTDEFISYLSMSVLDIKKEQVKDKYKLLDKYGFEVVCADHRRIDNLTTYEYKVLNQIVHGNYKDVRSGYYNEVMALEVEDIRKIIEFKEDTFAGRYYVIFQKVNNSPLVIKNSVNDVNTKHMMAPFIRRHKEAVIELSFQDVY